MLTERLTDEITSYRFVGLLDFREYIRNADVNQMVKEAEISLQKKDEIALVNSRAPFLKMNTMFQSTHILEGSVFMFALLCQDYDVAERILDHMETVSIQTLGSIKLHDGFSFDSGMFSDESSLCDLSTIECFLYEKSCMIPEEMRTKLMNRLEREGADVSQFSLKKIYSLEDLNIQILLLSDRKRYPKLFPEELDWGANDLASLVFQMKMCSKNQQILRLFRNSQLDSNQHVCQQGAVEERINDDVNRILWIVNHLKGRRKTHEEMYRFLIYRISTFRNYAEQFPNNESVQETLRLAEDRIWKAISDLPFPDLFFEKMMNDPKEMYSNPFRMEVLYELVYKKTGRKQSMIVKNPNNNGLEMFFEPWSTTEEFYLNEGLFFCYANGSRLKELIRYVDRIVYEEAGENYWNTIGYKLADLLTQYAEQLKPVFALLISKGLIPPQCLSYVMRRVNKMNRCEYMRPYMILLRFGGISSE